MQGMAVRELMEKERGGSRRDAMQFHDDEQREHTDSLGMKKMIVRAGRLPNRVCAERQARIKSKAFGMCSHRVTGDPWTHYRLISKHPINTDRPLGMHNNRGHVC